MYQDQFELVNQNLDYLYNNTSTLFNYTSINNENIAMLAENMFDATVWLCIYVLLSALFAYYTTIHVTDLAFKVAELERKICSEKQPLLATI